MSLDSTSKFIDQSDKSLTTTKKIMPRSKIYRRFVKASNRRTCIFKSQSTPTISDIPEQAQWDETIGNHQFTMIVDTSLEPRTMLSKTKISPDAEIQFQPKKMVLHGNVNHKDKDPHPLERKSDGNHTPPHSPTPPTGSQHCTQGGKR